MSIEKEYGGCLHFELNKGKSGIFDIPGFSKIELDSGRSALQYLCGIDRYKRIWLPLYNCPLVTKRLENTNIQIIYYHICEDFCPRVDTADFKEGDLFCFINYWGCMEDDLISEISGWQGTTPVDIVIDNIPAFFYPPIKDVFNIYSCRKFIGVPDGAYIVYNGHAEEVLKDAHSLEKSISYMRYYYLLKAVECGSNEAYHDYLDSEKAITDRDEPYGMSELTKRVLSTVDYESIKTQRRENYARIHDSLGATNQLTLNNKTQTPSVYPYLFENKELRDRLIENRIYVSRQWKHIMTDDRANAYEKKIAEYMIPLPIDQRYSVEDMDYISDMVKRFVG